MKRKVVLGLMFFSLGLSHAAGCTELKNLKNYSDPAYMIHEGKNGWFLRNTDFKVNGKISAEALPYIEILSRIFNDVYGSKIYMPLIPNRSMFIDPDEYPDTAKFDRNQTFQLYRETIKQLNKIGIYADDLTLLDGEGFFFKDDHHWKTKGVQETSAMLARSVARLKLLTEGDLEFKMIADGKYNSDFLTGKDVNKICNSNNLPETDVKYRFEFPESIGLFDDLESNVVLVGTSYSTKPSNFPGFLQYYLKSSIENYSMDGGGAFGGLEQYLVSSSFEEKKPKLMIWEKAYYQGFGNQSSLSLLRNLVALALGKCKSSRPALKKELLDQLTALNHRQKIDLFVESNVFDLKLQIKYANGNTENLTFTRNTNTKNTGWYSTLLPAGNPVQIDVTDLNGHPLQAQVETCAIR
ncbi:alginate O-acetyltransferase AlgX-related protein [Deinococcus cellulosilyticus]|uniref:AlgX/AlgJ SGNH hydrolase-like domain-containing protein n=1 Tax=Deinococcus cellulosilyticus (strain DSM 18568 / NBRC 106333 / KACC 11606 / 5516J-15) TaxID=1223518 RepID=A0A511N2C8_DEIC1|nr:hypothetical protein [Deinococcus cellulosilyticus]GEM47009.1 hypothetical protein DC3_26440 [Deinococcus cellulosilyticus NBRC 106333 = KACC 11606]